MIELIILTGVFGAGSTVAMKSFEEDGFFVTDNIPFIVAKDFFDGISKILLTNRALSAIL